MGDADRRKLQRTFDSEEEEAAWLVDRVRAGELQEDRLPLAAWCGHRPAALACSLDPVTPSLQVWLESIPSDADLLRRVSVAAGRLALEVWTVWERDHPNLVLPPPTGSLVDRARRLLLGPRVGVLEAILWEAIEGVIVPSSRRNEVIRGLLDTVRTHGYAASDSICAAALLVIDTGPSTAAAQGILGDTAHALSAANAGGPPPRPGSDPPMDVPESEQLRSRVRGEVAPWLLRYGRPLLELIGERRETLERLNEGQA